MLNKLFLTFLTNGTIIRITVENFHLMKAVCKNIGMITVCHSDKGFLNTFSAIFTDNNYNY